MSATTPAVHGGTGTQRLGIAMAAIALAIIVVAALVGFQAMASRTTSAAPGAAPAPATQFDHGTANDVAPAPASQFDHGTANDRAGAAAPIAPRVFDPRDLPQAPVCGGHGTRLAR
jgi:hypothetical protein